MVCKRSGCLFDVYRTLCACVFLLQETCDWRVDTEMASIFCLLRRLTRRWRVCCCCHCCSSTAHKQSSPTRLKVARKSVRGRPLTVTVCGACLCRILTSAAADVFPEFWGSNIGRNPVDISAFISDCFDGCRQSSWVMTLKRKAHALMPTT